jgi:gliding motility-associated-like protein
MQLNFYKNIVAIFSVLFFSISSLAAGDDPCTATPLTTSATCTYSAQDNNGSTASAGITAPGCASYSNNDVWFTIVVPASGNVQVDTQTGTITDGGIAFYTGATCSALTLLSCDDDSSPNGVMPLLVANGLTPGSTLYVRFWKYGGGSGTFSICATSFDTPLNDNPVSATTLTCGSTCTTVSSTFLGATQTLAGCTGNANDDVWFSFVATQSSVLITVTPFSSIDPVVQLFSGVPGSLTSITCDDASFPYGTSGTGQYNGLAIGQTYYYRVYGASSATPNSINSPFTTCVYNAPPPPINDNCAGSITVTSGVNCTSVSATVYGATQTLAGCTGNANDDVWFSFVAAEANQLISVTPVSGFDPVVELFSGTCGSLTSISCNNNSYPSGVAGNGLFSGLTVGQTYFYRVYQFNSLLPTATNSSFITCVTNIPTPPSNDDCVNGINLSVGSTCNPTTGLIYGATQSLASGCGSASTAFDVWFSFVATSSYQNITATLNNSLSVNLQVYSGTCNNLTSIYCGVLNPLIISFTTLDNLIAGQTYYYRIYPSVSVYPANTLAYSTCVTSATPNNQDCLGAIPLCQNVYTTTTAYAGVGNFNNEINGSLGCLSSGEKNDVWYTLNVITSGNLSFTISPTVTTNDYDWAVYNLTNANCSDINDNAALQVSCNFSGSSGPTGPNGLSGYQNNPIIPVTAGQTYMINVSQYSTLSNGYTLDFSASTATIFDNVAPVFQSVSAMSCGASGISATFSENVLCSTVSVADFTLVGPDGAHSVTNISGTGCALGGTMENTYSVSFTPPLTVSGNYTFSMVAVAGAVTDLCGNVAAPQSFDFTISVPTVTASTIQSVLCNGGTSGSITSTPSGGTAPYSYTWTSTNGQTETTQNVNNASAATYTITLADATGCTATANTIVTEPLLLDAVVTITQSTCNSLGEISTTVTGGTGNYNYTWTPNISSTSTAIDLVGGNYSVVVTDDNGCSTLPQNGVINTIPQLIATIDAVNDQCLTGNNFNFTATISAVPLTYSWDFGDNSPINTEVNPTYSYLNSGNFIVTLIVSDGVCTSNSTVNIDVFESLSVSVANTDVTCFNAMNGIAEATVTGGTAPFSYSWNSLLAVSDDPILENLAPGNYGVEVTDVNGCLASAQTTIAEPPAIIVQLTPENPTCVTLGSISSTANGGTGNLSYLWLPTNEVTPSISNLAVGSYTLQVSDQNGCISASTVQLTNTSSFTANINPLPGQCLNGNLFNFSSDVTDPMATFSWNFGDQSAFVTGSSPSYSFATPGNYTVNLTVTVGTCIATDSENANVYSMPAVQASSNIPCEGSDLVLSGLPSGMTVYNWTGPNNSTLQNPIFQNSTLASSGTYNLTVVDVNGCSATAAAQVIINQLPTTTISSNTVAGCVPLLSGFESTNTALTSYIWNFGDGTISNSSSVSHLFTEAGNYSVSITITDANGCSNVIVENDFVEVYALPTSEFQLMTNNPENLIDPTYTFTDLSSSDVVSWNWNFGDTSDIDITQNPQHTYLAADETYVVTLIAITAFGCADTSSQALKIDAPLLFYVPNTFTPDGDNFNQVFTPVFTSGVDPEGYSMTIFNRWGELLFESKDISVGWDGHYNGNMVQDGTYLYSIQFGLSADDRRKSIMGNVNLIR